ncbi:CDP-glycerol glycerophosphotransferase family protein [Pseudomonas fragi]|uniref:CDP-glycerol glycerophosphotransferase family protein n=1 Tax=Pseudomonas fragi TaxID=296 RepID=UPI002953B9DC|nr:CDP-glycerol glycerophosphotransferase family protein [Pseudomonas fragi]WOL29970.1 CDP-glycerol glycerophosphotransferase family protein [Pseudomonas fragi]
MNNLKKIFTSALLWPLYITTLLTPKSPIIWVFGAWGGRSFSDNSKYLYLHVQKNNRTINPVWITKSRNLQHELNLQGINAHYFISFLGIYYQLRASAAFFTHHQSYDFLGGSIAPQTKRYQLWHGTPLKKILWDDEMYSKRENTLKAKLIRKTLPWLQNKSTLVISASPCVSANLKTAFRSKVSVTGYPRNDSIDPGSISGAKRDIKKIIYMPTFRGVNSTASSNLMLNNILISSGFDVNIIDRNLSACDATLTLRLHPSNKLSEELKASIESSINIALDESGQDIYALLNQYDVLISDYSSIVFDYMLSGRPVIHAGFDSEEYVKTSRSLYHPYSSICLTPEIRNWTDVFAFIQSIQSSGLSAEYIEKYNTILTSSNYYRDQDSCKRITDIATGRAQP